MSVVYLWLASAFAALAGTLYWIRIPRHAPNKDTELFGLVLLYVWLAALTAVCLALVWVAKRFMESWH